MAYAPPPGPPPQNFQQPNYYGPPNPATQPGGYPGTYPPQDQTPPYDQSQPYPTDDNPPPDDVAPATSEYPPEEGQTPDAAEYAADSGVYPAEVTAVELQNDELIQDEGVDENGEARVLAQADESITLEPLVSVPEGESVLEKETTVSISAQEKAKSKSTGTPKDTNQVTKSQQYYGTKQYPSSYYNTRQTRSKSRHRHRHRQSYNYNTNQSANQQQQNYYSPCQIGVIPMRSAAFQAPRIPLPKLCNHLLPRDDGEPEEEDGVAFQFKPQTHCRTEVTFTIEPKPQPPWLTMLNCGFKPMVNCSAPPCYLSPNGNPGMDYMGGTQTVVNRAFGTEVQYSGMANFPTLQQIQSTFPGSGVIDASNMNKQKKNTRRHGRGSEEESGSSESGSGSEEESEGEQKPQIRSHRYSYQPARVPKQHHAYNAQKQHEQHHQQYQQQLAQYHAAHHRHHQQLHHHYQHYQNAIQNAHHSTRRKSREQSVPKKEVRHRSKVRKHVKPQDKQILHHHHHHHTGPHGHSSNKPIGEVVAKKSMAAAPRKSLVAPRKSLVVPHPHEHHHHHDHHRRSSATEEAYHYHDHDVDELSRSSDWHG